MKEVKAFIKPHRIENVVDSLQESGFDSVTLSECEGTGNFKRQDSGLSLKFHFADSRMIKLELVCRNTEVQTVIDVICREAKTPYPADGIIYITDIVEAFRIKDCSSCSDE
jgi:nitrogen regulatory protein P-II 1